MACGASIGALPTKKTNTLAPLFFFQGLVSSYFLLFAFSLSSNAPLPSAHSPTAPPANNYDHLQNSAMSIHRHNGIQHRHKERGTLYTHARTVCYTHRRTQTHTHRDNTKTSAAAAAAAALAWWCLWCGLKKQSDGERKQASDLLPLCLDRLLLTPPPFSRFHLSSASDEPGLDERGG